jgi:hypothetical protein
MYDIFIVKIFVKYTEKDTNTMKYLLHFCGELKWEEYFFTRPLLFISRKWKVESEKLRFEEYENTEIWRDHYLAKSKVFGGQYLYWIFWK